MNPLNSVKGAITTGVVLAVAAILVLHVGAFNELIFHFVGNDISGRVKHT